MSFGFSIGDFLAVGRLVAKVVDALRSTRSEYQELIHELESLEIALLQVENLRGWGDQAATVDLIRYTAISCMFPLEVFLAKIQKYEKSLGLGKTAGKCKDAGRKVQYAFVMEDEVNRLRNRLNMRIGTIKVLLLCLGLDMHNGALEQIATNQQELMSSIDSSTRELQEVRGSVKTQALALREDNSILRKLLWMVSDEIVAPLKSLSQAVTNICVTMQQVYTIVLEMRNSDRDIDTRFTYFQAPVRVEDALGRVFPFPSECSVEALTAEIKARFQEGPGNKEVMAGDFEIFNAKNTAQLLAASGNNVLLPGRPISMAIILEVGFANDDECPMQRCASKTFAATIGGGKFCSQCKVWFDGASDKRQRLTLLLERLEIIMERNTKSLMLHHREPQEASGLSTNEITSEVEQLHSEETSISAFKRIKYYTSLEVATNNGFHLLIDFKRQEFSYLDTRRQGKSPESRRRQVISLRQIPSVVFGLVQTVSFNSFVEVFYRSLISDLFNNEYQTNKTQRDNPNPQFPAMVIPPGLIREQFKPPKALSPSQ